MVCVVRNIYVYFSTKKHFFKFLDFSKNDFFLKVMELITSNNVEKQEKGFYHYWKDANGGKISIRILNSGCKKLKVKNIKIYNELIGRDLQHILYKDLLEIVENKKDEDKDVLYLKIKKPTRDFNGLPFKIVVVLENGEQILSPDIYVYSKKYRSKKRLVNALETIKNEVVKKRKKMIVKKSKKTQTIQDTQLKEALKQIKCLQSDMRLLKKEMEQNNQHLRSLFAKKKEDIDEDDRINKIFAESEVTENFDLWWAKDDYDI